MRAPRPTERLQEVRWGEESPRHGFAVTAPFRQGGRGDGGCGLPQPVTSVTGLAMTGFLQEIFSFKKPRRVCRPQAAKKSNHFSPRHVRGEKYLSGCQCGILSLATKLCAQQTANPFGRKFRRNFLPVKKRDARRRLFSVICRLYLTYRPWPCWPRPFRRRYRRASWTPQP